MTKLEALAVIQNEYDNADDGPDSIKDACRLAINALMLSIRLGPDAEAKCARCGAQMAVLVRGHHHTETFNGIEKDVTKNANGL